MKLLMATIIGVSAALSSGSLSFASSAAKPAGATYTTKFIKFNYPSGWSKVSHKNMSSFARMLSSSAGGYAEVSDDAGVESVNKKTQHAGVAVLVKMTFTKSFQKQLKGNRQLFIKKFEQGVTRTARKVVSKGHGRFAGQNAVELQVILGSGPVTHDQFFIALASNGKSVDMAIMVAVPSGAWGAYSSAFSRIAASSSFK
jgi:hypothetical protein